MGTEKFDLGSSVCAHTRTSAVWPKADWELLPSLCDLSCPPFYFHIKHAQYTLK